VGRGIDTINLKVFKAALFGRCPKSIFQGHFVQKHGDSIDRVTPYFETWCGVFIASYFAHEVKPCPRFDILFAAVENGFVWTIFP
jgi:hypothetical protein